MATQELKMIFFLLNDAQGKENIRKSTKNYFNLALPRFIFEVSRLVGVPLKGQLANSNRLNESFSYHFRLFRYI
jgi:hypothetical protein